MTAKIKRTAKSTRTRRLVLLGVLLGCGVVAVAMGVAGRSAPSTPTIVSTPPAVSSSASATFTFSGAPGSGSYQCSVDASAFAACTSPKTYAGLAAGSHTFQVRALDNKGKQSAPASFSWTIDLTAPTVSSVARGDSSPRNAGPLHWTVTFSEPVNGVAAGNFALATSNLGGTAPSISSVAPTGSAPTATWTVTVSTTGTTGQNAGSIGLNLTSVGTIKDVATNPLVAVPATGQAYGYDTTAPLVSSIVRAGSTPTNAAAVSWTVNFSEPVTGVAAGSFALVASGFTGTPAVTAVSGSGATYTVTASTGTGTTTNAASLQLRLTSAGTIRDAATNAPAGLPVNGQTYVVDRLAPPLAFTLTPPDPSSTATSKFAWQSQPPASDFDRYECSAENGPGQPCASPLTYAVGTTNNGQHQFSVRAYDTLGNFTQITYSWKVQAGSIQEFTIDGNAVGLLYPGGPARPIAVTLHNPNGIPIYVSALTVSATADTPAGCSHADLVVHQADLSSAAPTPNEIVVPANDSITLPAQGVAAPTIRLLDNGSDQTPACAGQTFNLGYSGSAHS